MATLVVSGQAGIREGLMDVITNISFQDTALLSALPKKPVKSTYVEWQTQALPAPNMNRNTDGAAWTAGSITATVRTGNRTQIIKRAYTISDSIVAVQHAGAGGDELSYQRKQALMAHARDLEYMILNGTGAAATSSRSSRGVRSWAAGVATNQETGSGSATAEALTEGMFLNAMKRIFANAGRPTDVYVNAHLKRKISSFKGNGGNATVQFMGATKTLSTVVGVYDTDFGTLKIHLHDLATATEVLILTQSDFALGVLRPTQIKEVLPGACDGVSFGVLTEATVICYTNYRSGKIVNLSTVN